MSAAKVKVLEAYRDRFGRDPEVMVRAPGRLCLLGAHVDTSEGLVLPGAIDRSLWLAVSRNKTTAISLLALDLESEVQMDLRQLPPPVFERNRAEVSWSDYPGGVAWILAREGYALTGLEGVLGGDLPRGSGMSSSAAVEIAFLLAWNRICDLALPAETLARLAARVEQEYVGVRSGVMDPFASLFGARDQLILLDCRDLSFTRVPLSRGVGVVVVDSGIRRSLAASGFNQRRIECHEALKSLRERFPRLGTLRDLEAVGLDGALSELPVTLARRARHVAEECDRVRQGGAALAEGDIQRFGQLMTLSHESSRDLFESSLPELDAIAAAAWQTAGCLGARFMGGGFGGCVAALVEEGFQERVRRAMTEVVKRASRQNQTTGFSMDCRFGEGAEVLEKQRFLEG